MKYLINLSYNGSKYYGYQIQKNKITVEGQIEKVLSKIFNGNINTLGTSRTDKGVHANNQYCVFEVNKDINTRNLTHSMNSMLDDYIYIKKIVKVNDELNMGEYNPIEAEYTFQYCKNIDRKLLDKFICKISGTHNFKSFTSDKDKTSYERTVSVDYKISNKILYLRFESTGFLRYMIRNIVGLLIDINNGKKSIDDIDKIFMCENRCSLGVCASGCGLYLNKIEFE